MAVIEAGLGGRLDATAVIYVRRAGAHQHRAWSTRSCSATRRSAILKEKAAVIPPHGKVVAGVLTPDLKAELKEFCAAREAECHFFGDDLVILADPRGESFDIFGLYGCYMDVRLKVLGGYQRVNAAVAVAAVELFNGGELDAEVVRPALASTAAPGRLEVISTQPLCIFDGSHNPPGMEETMRSLDPILERRRLIAVVSILRDKDAVEMIRHLAPRCDIIFATQSSSPRALSADELAALISEAGQGTGGLRRSRSPLGHGERVPAGHLQPGGAGDRVADPHLRPQAGDELDRG